MIPHTKAVQAHEGCAGHGVLKVYVQEQGKDWELVDVVHNLVTYAGINKLLSVMSSISNTAYFGWIAVSTSAAAPSTASTTLVGEVFRKAVDSVTPNTGARSIGVIATLNFADANGNSLQKYGLFSAAALGTIWNETNHVPISKTSLIQVKYDYTYTLS